AKIAALADLPATWHFIGTLQGNKARDVAERFDWVHAVDRARIAELLSRHRPAGRRPLNVCVEVNISEEATKSGVKPGEALALARLVATLPGLRFRGLMGMASPSGDEARARAEFSVLRRELEAIRAAGIPGDTLSMGMSQDWRAALAEGATMLRIGTAIFGAREAHAWKAESA
ncbi:MAG TPA: YggS family pyridoxal phosphate-dependent enzyme, partial [Usitatibacteraceae bacterium]|nr:YggS family pyridoxal phosphate-dependent enzyme [Usitatibacteraceae bacterium]